MYNFPLSSVLLDGGPNRTHIVDLDRPITGVRTFDLTPGGSSIVGITEGAIGQNRLIITAAGSTAGAPFNVRVTAFSSSTLAQASIMLMAILMFFTHYLR